MKKLLIANRGEIAVRIIRTCKQLGINTVAVYSEADANHPHVKLANEAVCIGPPPATDSYLHAERIIKAAADCKAQAIHPGYGFLSESADFAEQVAAAGLIFVGPRPETLRVLGEKQRARDIARQLNVPILPGYYGNDQSPEHLAEECSRLGLPVMIKAVAGGGGRGMRRIDSLIGFSEKLASAKREAKAGFGNDQVFIEKVIYPARHIEVQVLGDGRGQAIHLFERECSLQRRFQKIIEEAPAPFLSKQLRAKLLKAAVTIAREVNLLAAATFEFLIPWSSETTSDEFYFLEANPRLQVEHPVTEMITVQDIVKLQINAVTKNRIPKQSAIRFSGHCIEARVCAEAPREGFPPSTGRIYSYNNLNDSKTGVRVDHGLAQGVTIGMSYDSLLAKVIVHNKSRLNALKLLSSKLNQFRILGVDTNIPFLCAILDDPALQEHPASTTYIDENCERLLALDDLEMSLARAAAISKVNYVKTSTQGGSNIFHELTYFRPGQGMAEHIFLNSAAYSLTASSGTFLGVRSLELRQESAIPRRGISETGLIKSVVRTDNKETTFLFNPRDSTLAQIEEDQDRMVIEERGFNFILESDKRKEAEEIAAISSGALKLFATLPGIITSIKVALGDNVETGDLLAVLESMKIEHCIYAPEAGKIEALNVDVGQSVKQGELILTINRASCERT